MDKEILNSDGSRNYQANILLDNVKRLQAENERLKEEKGGMQILIDNYIALTEKYHQALQEIREMAEKMYYTNDEDTERDLHIELQAKINEIIGVE